MSSNNTNKLKMLLDDELYPPLREEIDHLLDVYADSEDNPDYDEVDAFDDIWDRIEDHGYSRFFIRACRDIAVQVGYLLKRNPKKNYIGYKFITHRGEQYSYHTPWLS